MPTKNILFLAVALLNNCNHWNILFIIIKQQKRNHCSDTKEIK